MYFVRKLILYVKFIEDKSFIAFMVIMSFIGILNFILLLIIAYFVFMG